MFARIKSSFKENELKPLSVDYDLNGIRRYPIVEPGWKVACCFDQFTIPGKEQIILCDSLEDMNHLYSKYHSGLALKISWYAVLIDPDLAKAKEAEKKSTTLSIEEILNDLRRAKPDPKPISTIIPSTNENPNILLGKDISDSEADEMLKTLKKLETSTLPEETKIYADFVRELPDPFTLFATHRGIIKRYHEELCKLRISAASDQAEHKPSKSMNSETVEIIKQEQASRKGYGY